jgi:NAD+ synthase (glutamine-hydrolysing)
MRRLLTTVYQSTKNSSETTRSAAESLAIAIGSRHVELDVDSLVEDYKSIVSTALGHTLDWSRDDLALQNIQARVRAPSAWLIANLQGALLLATSNRSEAAVGYATMDGDTAGGLSPIAGIDKAFIRRYLVWLEQEGLAELGPISALSVVNVQAPTAELRPSSQGQTDEADLMPYELLDVIERKSIADRCSPSDVFAVIRAEFPEYSESQLLTWLERFYALFCRNQWKRERYAPSFHVDDANLDPKTWCRFPILSGGYARELAELRGKLGKA